MKQILYSEKVIKRNVSYSPIDDTYCEYTDIRKIIINGSSEEIVQTSGIATIEEIEGLKEFDNISGHVKVDWMYNGYGGIVGISKETYNKLLNAEIHISEIYKDWSKEKPYDPEKYIYCIYNSGAWHIADLNKRAIRYPFYFDYINGRVTDVNYDLKKVLEFMKSDSRFIPIRYKDKNAELSIMKIPYYNADDYTGHYAIEFCYLPDNDKETLELMTSLSYDKFLIMEKILEQFKIKNPYENS